MNVSDTPLNKNQHLYSARLSSRTRSGTNQKYIHTFPAVVCTKQRAGGLKRARDKRSETTCSYSDAGLKTAGGGGEMEQRVLARVSSFRSTTLK